MDFQARGDSPTLTGNMPFGIFAFVANTKEAIVDREEFQADGEGYKYSFNPRKFARSLRHSPYRQVLSEQLGLDPKTSVEALAQTVRQSLMELPNIEDL